MKFLSFIVILLLTTVAFAEEGPIEALVLNADQQKNIVDYLNAHLPKATVVLTVEHHKVSGRELYTVFAAVTTEDNRPAKGKYAWFGDNLYDQARCALADAIKQLR